MKYTQFLISAALLSNAQYIISAQAASHELTPADKSCFAWFEATSKSPKFPSILQKLTPEDLAVYDKKLNYAEFPQEVTRARNNYVDLFFNEVKNADIKEEYDANTLKAAMLKVVQAMQSTNAEEPTDLLTARTFVYAKLLSPEEKAMWGKYRTNPEEVEQVTAKWSGLLADKLAEIKLIDNTPEAKAETSKTLYAEKITELKKTWGQPTANLSRSSSKGRLESDEAKELVAPLSRSSSKDRLESDKAKEVIASLSRSSSKGRLESDEVKELVASLSRNSSKNRLDAEVAKLKLDDSSSAKAATDESKTE